MENIVNVTLAEDLIDNKDNQLNEPLKVVSNRMINKKLTSKRRKDMLIKVIEFNISNNHLSQDKKTYLKQLLTEAKYYYNYLLNLSQHSCVDDYGNLVYTHPIHQIDTKNNTTEVNQITAFKFNLTPEQRAIISLTGVGLDAGIGDEITLNCGNLYQSFSLNSRCNKFLLETLAKIKVAQKELSHFSQRTKRLNKHKLSTGNNEDKKVIVNIKGINKPLVKPTVIYSRKYMRLKNRLAKLWVKYENIKNNMINHLIGFLKQFKQVNFQNEMIKSWHQDKLKGYSKKVQAGILGKVYAKLKLLNITNPEKYRMLATYHKTTQDCVMCGKANKLKLSDRIYKCSCSYENNRDTNGAFNMILKNDLIETNKNNQSFKNKVFGRNTVNLVQMITSETSKDNTKNVFDIAGSKLESKSYVKLSFNSHISHTRSLVL